jgi:hypothetical protein
MCAFSFSVYVDGIKPVYPLSIMGSHKETGDVILFVHLTNLAFGRTYSLELKVCLKTNLKNCNQAAFSISTANGKEKCI